MTAPNTTPSVCDVVITRRLAKLDSNSVLRVRRDAPMPRTMTQSEIHAAARMVLYLAEVVRRCALDAGMTPTTRVELR